MIEGVKREAKRRLLSLIHNVNYRVKRRRMAGLLDSYDPSVCTNPRPGSRSSICFIITRMVRFHGGQTSILRLGTRLAGFGMDVTYLVYKKQSVKDMNICAEANLKGFKGTCRPLDDYLNDIREGRCKAPDIAAASSWDTVSKVKLFNDSYKMYFVQDYEPYFYEYGEEFLMCKNTYEQGLHMVSLGSWNAEMIRRECSPVSRLDVVSFPYEKSEYPFAPRDYDAYAGRKKLTLAVYVKFYGKRLPNLIPYMLKATADKLGKEGIELEVLYFGEAKTFKAEGGRNLGHLTREELRDLYARADFGMVASMSNISLVPYEMLSAGLPLIEFEDGTYTYFLPPESAILTHIGERDIADRILKAIRTPGYLAKMHEAAAGALKDLSWDRTGREFHDIINSI